jgi:hypothetical protein
MAKLDALLLLAFGAIALITLIVAVLCFRKALLVTNQKDGDIKMFLWAVATFISLIISGLSTAYIVLPIIFHIT